MSQGESREIHLKSRPVGVPTEENFEVVSVPLPQAKEGEVLVRNLYMSVDPYMRSRMADRKSYTPPFQLGEAMTGGAVGQVEVSHNEQFQPGDHVLSMYGWRDRFTSDGRHLTKIDPTLAPIQTYLGTMGMPGQTAYFGLLDIGQPQAGETVFVSAAAGAVGSVVCQIAKLKGCRVVGSVGSAAKVAWLEEIGVDAAFNYKEADDLTATLKKLCPDGLDVYFENVGGEHLQAAIAVANNHARFPICGMISLYNASMPMPGPTNITSIIGKRLRLQGFIVTDFRDEAERFYADMSQWIARGKITWRETVVDGLENAPRRIHRAV